MPDELPSNPDALSDPETLRALHETTGGNDETRADEHAADAKEWLGDLMLLHGVPFPYLVPDERALPPNSLRFFFVDRNWVHALMEGALSVGRDHDAHEAHDAAFADELKGAARRAATTVRARLFGQAPPDADAAAAHLHDDAPPDAPDEDGAPDPIPTMTGFLLRSTAVSDWPGLRVKAWAKSSGDEDDQNTGDALTMLRLERLSSSILLGLFKGTVHKLRLGRAVETLHFGLEHDGGTSSGPWEVALRSPKTGTPTKTNVAAPMRNDRTVQAHSLADDMAKKLDVASDDFSSADFALEMVQSTREVVFTLERSGD